MPTRGYRKGLSDQKVAVPRYVRSRLSNDEYVRLSADADSRAATVSKVLRSLVIAHLAQRRAQLPHPRGLTTDLLHQFARIGNNLNQLAHQAHHGMVPVSAEELRDCIAKLNRLASTL